MGIISPLLLETVESVFSSSLPSLVWLPSKLIQVVRHKCMSFSIRSNQIRRFAKFAPDRLVSGGNDSSLFIYSLVLDTKGTKKKEKQIKAQPVPPKQSSRTRGRGRGRGRTNDTQEQNTATDPHPKEVEPLEQPENSKVIARIDQKSKINWLETSQQSTYGNLFVADQTNVITSFTLG